MIFRVIIACIKVPVWIVASAVYSFDKEAGEWLARCFGIDPRELALYEN